MGGKLEKVSQVTFQGVSGEGTFLLSSQESKTL